MSHPEHPESENLCPHCGKEIESYLNRNPVSFGDWEDEKSSVAYLLNIIDKSELFKVFREVEGSLLQPRLHSSEKTMRTDLILKPNLKLVQAGWDGGLIGIECKKSGLKLNLPFAQSLDYARTVWRLNNGFHIMCEYFFLWPYWSVGGFAASVMAQQRIGTVEFQQYADPKWNILRLKCGESKVLYYRTETDEIDVGPLKSGHKSGSR